MSKSILIQRDDKFYAIPLDALEQYALKGEELKAAQRACDSDVEGQGQYSFLVPDQPNWNPGDVYLKKGLM